MALDQKFFKKSTAGSGTDQEQGLVLHLDANDVDSYDGDGSIWYDINGHEVNIPLTDNDDNLEIHIDASNSNSYAGTGSTITDISTNGYSFSTHGNATFGSDLRGYFTLDGSDDGLRTTNAVTGFSGDVTFEWWFNASESNNFALLHANPLSNDTGINGIFIGNAAGGAGAIEIYRRTTGGTLHSGQTSSTGLSGMASDGWVHFVITITSANVCKFYKDGSYAGTLTLNGNGTNHDTYNFVSIGGYNSASYEFAGQMGCFRMYSEILTASQIGQNFRAGNFLNYSSLITSKHETTQGAIVSTNLIHSLDANEYSGSGDWPNTANSSFNATITGATYVNDGNSDYFSFDGNDYVQIPTSTDFNIGNTKTFEMWHWLDSTYDETLLYQGNSTYTISTLQYHFRVNGGNYQMLTYNSSGSFILASGSSSYFTATTNSWHHLAITFAGATSGSDVKIYLDGVEVKSTTLSANANTGNHPVSIGRRERSVAYSYFNGRIGQVRFYSSALSASQISTNYNESKGLYLNPNLAMHLDAGDDTTVSASTWSDKANSNDATLSGFSSTLSDFYDKELGNWLNFDGSDDTGDISHHSDLDTSTTFTVEAWVQRNDNTERYILVKQGGSNSYGYSLQFHPTSSLGYYFVVYNTANSLFSVAATVAGSGTAGLWQHVVGVIDGTNIYLYINGNRVASSTYSGTLADSDSVNLFLGRYPAGATRWLGKIGQARIYQSALSPAQVVQNYLATKNKYPNSHHATIVGSPTWGTYNSGGVTYNYFDLNGSSQYMTIPQNTIFDFELPTTLEVWVNKDGTGREWVIQKSNGGSGSYSWQLEHASSGNYRFQMHNTSNGVITVNVTSTTNTGTWYHIAITHDGSNVYKIYLNGSLQESATLSGTISKNTNGVSIGTYHVGGYEFDGKIGMVKFHNKTFSATEVDAAFDNTKATYGVT